MLTYLLIPAIHDLAKAENWYLHSLKLTDERDLLWQSKCLQTLGAVGLKRFEDAQAAGKPEEELLSHLNKALQFYQQALEMIPPDAVDDLAKAHSMLGVIYNDAYDLDRALQHYREAIRYYEMEGDIYGAAITRYNVALDLAQADVSRMHWIMPMQHFATMRPTATARRRRYKKRGN